VGAKEIAGAYHTGSFSAQEFRGRKRSKRKLPKIFSWKRNETKIAEEAALGGAWLRLSVQKNDCDSGDNA
jgi:hypothetical protein